MRNAVLLPALGIALLTGTSLAGAQTVETRTVESVVTPAPTVIAQEPLVVSEPARVIETVPVQTTETIRTVRRSTFHPTRRMAHVRALKSDRADTVTTTRTTVREIAPAPVAPAVTAITQPGYTEVVQAPPPALRYPAPLYDYVPAGIAPPVAAVEQVPLPAYRYVYQSDRILVIDANTGVAVQALPR